MEGGRGRQRPKAKGNRTEPARLGSARLGSGWMSCAADSAVSAVDRDGSLEKIVGSATAGPGPASLGGLSPRGMFVAMEELGGWIMRVPNRTLYRSPQDTSSPDSSMRTQESLTTVVLGQNPGKFLCQGF